MATDEEVRGASSKFYGALIRMAGGDASAMADVWSHGPDVTAMHPIGGRHVGWDAVRGSFEKFAALASAGKVELKDQLIHVGEGTAWEMGVEHGHVTLAGQQVTLEHRVTNIYRKDGGVWKMVHHHTDVSAALVDIVHGV